MESSTSLAEDLETYNESQFDHGEAIEIAHEHGSGNKDLFQTALIFLDNNKEDHEKPIDEDKVRSARWKAYNGLASGLSANSLGSAAAVQIWNFPDDYKEDDENGTSPTELISFAMAEATKLFDKYEGGSSGNKQDAVNSAAMTMMKFLVQPKYHG
ncbi:hypothetical protein C0995_013447 [Termitomyces sp. Mi166|nr:hypothetical protein C0995_013447 [Termitomyces sp. Mi166\